MFLKGQKILCLNSAFPLEVKRQYLQLPREGLVYTVRSCYVGRSRAGEAGEIGVLLDEIHNPLDVRVKGKLKPELGFSAERFQDYAT